MKKKVLLIAHFMDAQNEKTNNRFNYIAEQLCKEDVELEVITSDFSHRQKKKRKIEDNKIDKYKLTMLKEPSYNKNISLRRFYSHFILGKNLKKYLKGIKEIPDIIYCAVPSLNVAKVAAKYANKNNIRFIIDVQDLWPEAFKLVFKVPIISNIIFYPMRKSADYIYKSANDIIAVSNTYLRRATKVNTQSKNQLSVFLGTELKNFDMYSGKKQYVDDNNVKLVYIGTLGHSYDITCIIDAIKILKDKNIDNIKFIVMGDGPLKENFESYAKSKGIQVEFTGMLEYKEMVKRLVNCDIAVNPISKGAAQSIINKVGDYAAAALPVINTQECEEYRKLVEDYQIGFNCENGNIVDISQKIEKLCEDKNLIEKLGKNNRKLAEEKFDRQNTYKKIINVILN